jgi:hypothetical protein
MMADTNMDWVKEQLTQNKTKKVVGDSVIKLLGTWDEIKKKNEPLKTVNPQDIIDIFSKLSMGYVLVKEIKNERWVKAQIGQIRVADVIRIPFDAFDDSTGKSSLNGRRGRIVAVRSGDIIIKTDDEKLPVLDGVHIRPEFLEKLV